MMKPKQTGSRSKRTNYRLWMLLLMPMLLSISLFSAKAQQAGTLQDSVVAVSWSPDGQSIAVGSRVSNVSTDLLHSVNVQILNAQAQQLVHELPTCRCVPTSLDWSPDSTKVVGGNLDTYGFRLWNAFTGELIAVSPIGGQGVNEVEWRPNSSTFMVIGYGGSLGLFDGNTVEFIPNSLRTGETASWNSTGTQLVTSYEQRIFTLDATSGAELAIFSGHTSDVRDVEWSSDDQFIASASRDDTVRVWNASNGRLLRIINVLNPIDIAWNADSQRLATASYKGDVQVWNARTGEQLVHYVHPGRVNAIDWSPDGRQLVYGGVEAEGQSPLQIVPAPTLAPLTATPNQ